MKRLKDLLGKKWFAYTFAMCSAVVLYVILSHIESVVMVVESFCGFFSPIVLGLVISYVINPISIVFERWLSKIIKKEPIAHGIAVAGTIIVTFAAIVAILVLLIPSLIDSIRSVIANLSLYEKNLNVVLTWLEQRFPDFDTTSIRDVMDNAMNIVIRYVPRNLNTIVNTSIGIGTGIFNFVLGIILAVYFLLGKSSLKKSGSRLLNAALTEKQHKNTVKFLYRCHDILVKYIGYDLLDGIIIGTLNAIIMLAFGMDYIPLVSIVVAATNLIPTFGPIVGGVLGTFILFFSDPKDAIIFVVVTIVLQILDGYVLKPRMFGGVLGVPPVWILITIIVGGGMFGVVGILLAIPFAAIFTFVYDEAIIPALERARDKRK